MNNLKGYSEFVCESNNEQALESADDFEIHKVLEDKDSDMIENLLSVLEEKGDRAKIMVDGYPYYLKKIDSTHLYFSNNPDREGSAAHVNQYSDEPYHDDMVDWLHGKFDIDGEKYYT